MRPPARSLVFDTELNECIYLVLYTGWKGFFAYRIWGSILGKGKVVPVLN